MSKALPAFEACLPPIGMSGHGSAGRVQAIPAAVDAVQRGELIVVPTDTVYGVGCSPFNADAIEKLYTAKQRPHDKPLQVLLADIEHIELVATGVTPLAQKLMERFWPGASSAH